VAVDMKFSSDGIHKKQTDL